MNLFVELKRRNVFRASAAYLALGWVVTQVTSTVAPALHLPDWIVPVVVWIGVIGFPFVVIFSWVFELTPEGLKRERDIVHDDSIKHVTARRLDHLAIGLFALAIALLAADRFVVRGSAPATAPTTATAKDAGAAANIGASEKSAPANDKSIAVLPFADLSPGRDQEYFSDGMAEEILDALAQVQDLKVAGRTSSFFFKGKNETLQAIGAALGVAHVLEGSVRTQGNKVRITAQLIQTRDGFHLWSQSYDGDLSDVFQLQERIARAITDQLKVVLQGGQKVRLAQKGTPSAEAHEQYLRGRYFWNARGIENLQNAASAFKAALAADPDYADAWAGLAQTYALLPEYSVLDPASSGRIDSVALALEAANHALQLEPDSSAALLARAYVRCMFQFDWLGAEADYRAAIAGNARDPGARHWYAELLMYQRRWPEAAVQYDAALANDPLRPITHLSRALSLWFQGKPEAALPDFDESLRLAPGFHYSTMEKTKVLAQLRRFDEAAAAARTLPAGEREVMLSFIAAMQDPSKQEAAVREILAHGPGGVIGKPILFALLDRNDLTLTELERLFAEQDPYRAFVYMIPAFDPLRADPRFQALVRQVNLPPPAQGKMETP
jgi:TolB-like protein/Tfp pilus assembly protein PilF